MNKGALKTFSISELAGLPAEGLSDDFILVSINEEREKGQEYFKYPCRIDAMTLVFCTGGTIKIKVNLKEYEVGPGTVLFNMPDNIIQVDYSKNFTAKYLVISSGFMKDIRLDLKNMIPLMLQLRDRVCFPVPEHDIEALNQFFNLIDYAAGLEQSLHKTEIQQGLISSLVYRICDAFSDLAEHDRVSVKSRRGLYFEQFISLLTEYHRSERTVGFYADKICVTPKYLSALIKEVSGKSAAEWIDDYVILEAKTLLKFSDMSIQEIAYSLNFSTQSFFGKYFKHQTGMSPSEYKLR